jgi:hypothetical protein
MNFDGQFNEQADRSRIELQLQASGPQPIMTTLTGVTDGSVMYMSSPLFAGQLPNGAQWMRLDVSDFGAEQQDEAADVIESRTAPPRSWTYGSTSRASSAG